MNVQEAVTEFHQVYNVPVGKVPTLLLPDREDLRMSLINEEHVELEEAVEAKDMIEIADALGDLVYVCFGMAIEMGINLNDIIEEIHQSNLSKLDANSDPIVRADGKILKGPFFKEPDIRAVLEAQYAR